MNDGSHPSFGLLAVLGSRVAVLLLVIAFSTSVQAQEWRTTEWTARCVEARGVVCDLGDSRVEQALRQLQEASRTLETIGFRSPKVQQANGFFRNAPYVAHVQEPAFVFDLGSGAGGYSFDNGILTAAYGEPSAFDEMLVHEVFHAVQASYGVDGFFMDDGKDWVLEGMAEAIGIALSESQGSTGDYGTPYFDSPLNDLTTSAGHPVDIRYATYPFWLYLAKRYGGVPPGRYHIFDVFLAEAEKQVKATPALSGSIPIADAALRAIDPDGFYDIYPAFIAEVGNHPEFFENGVEVQPRSDQSGNSSTETQAIVRPLAARAFTVNIPELGSAGNHAVEIRLETDDPEALHLLVGDERYDKVSGPHRNVYFETGEDLDRELFLRVANVAATPAANKDQNFKLIVTVYHEFVEIEGASIQPDASSGSKPDNADIDSPIAVSARAVSQFWGPMRLRLILEAGLDKPCMFQLDAMSNDKLTGISMMLLQNGPMPPGEYPIARPGPKEIVGQKAHAQEYAGQVVATFVLDEKHPLVGEYGMQYMGQVGVLTIETITPRWVTGHARIAGTWTTTRPTYLPYDAPPAGPTDLTIEMAFSVSNAAIASRVDTASCIGP